MFNWILGLLVGLGIAGIIEGHEFGWYFIIGFGVLILLKNVIWMEVFK